MIFLKWPVWKMEVISWLASLGFEGRVRAWIELASNTPLASLLLINFFSCLYLSLGQSGVPASSSWYSRPNFMRPASDQRRSGARRRT